MMRTFRSGIALVTVLVVSMGTLAVQGYSTYGRWMVAPVVFYANPANADMSAAAAEAALQSAMNVWNNDSGSSFRFSYGGRVSDTSTGYDGRNVVVFRNEANGGTLAVTYSWSSGGSIVDADIIFYDGGFQFFTGASGCSSGAYIEDVGVHEFGHALGLLHSDRADASMYPTMGWCSQEWRSLSPDDIAGAQNLYPGGSTGTVPAAPSQLNASANPASPTSSIVLSWVDNASDETGYRVQRSTNGSSFSQIAQLGPTQSFTDSGLAGAATYYYRVFAFNDQGNSNASNIASAQTQQPTVANTAPTVSISSPTNGSSQGGAPVTFSGSASDSQDGNLSSSIVWTSSVDGTLGTGSGFSRSLSTGTHSITARVTDSGGLISTSLVSITVTSASSTDPVLTAAGSKVKGNQQAQLSWRYLTTSTVDVYRSGTRVTTTPNDGSHLDLINKKGGGSYSYKVCNADSSVCTNSVTVSF